MNINKSVFLILFLLLKVYCFSQLDFHNEIYYIKINNDLVTSGQSLSSFDFNNGQNSTTGGILGGGGVYYPVVDSYRNNLWVHLTWLRPDPNGTTIGANVPSTNKEATNVYFTTKSIGGWTGFLYEIEIYKDQNISGTRANKLNGLFPTTVKAASVEFLTTNFPGYTFTELVSFNILDNNSSGWILDSINFSGKNLKSNPGFSATKNFTTAGSVVGFTPTFPTGSKDIYAVSLAMGTDYSEFMMSASNVSRFLYGYESPGLMVGQGAQAMSLSFGAPLENCSNSVSIFKEDFGSGPNPGRPLTAGTTNLNFRYPYSGNANEYHIVNDLSGSGCVCTNTKDHTGNPNGYMMAINASITPTVFYTKTFPTLSANTTYVFSAWIMNIQAAPQLYPDLPDVTFVLEDSIGKKLGTNTTGIIRDIGVWRQYQITFTIGNSNTNIVLKLQNNTFGSQGNDLALDDIELSICDKIISDSCSIKVIEECQASGMIKLTAVDHFNQVVQANYKHEILWNIFQKGETKPTQLFNKNPIEVQNGTRYECTSKKYSWKPNLPKTKALADVCKRIILDTVAIDCLGPCNDFELILSSCEDDYDKANALQFTEPTCVSICGPSCNYIIALFEKENGKLIDPREYDITWSNHQKGAFVNLMGSYYNHISVVVKKGDCTWYGRYIESCENYSSIKSDAKVRSNISGRMTRSQLQEFLDQNKTYKLYNVLGQMQSWNQIEYGQYILTDGINFRNIFIYR